MLELERRGSPKVWRERFSCHLVAVSGMTLFSLKQEKESEGCLGDLGCTCSPRCGGGAGEGETAAFQTGVGCGRGRLTFR